MLYARSQGGRVALGFALGVVAELAVLYPALHRFGLNGLCLAMTVGLSVTGMALVREVKPRRSPEIGRLEVLKGGTMMAAGLGAAWMAAWALRDWPIAALVFALILGGSLALAIGFVSRSALTTALLAAWTAVRRRRSEHETPLASNDDSST